MKAEQNFKKNEEIILYIDDYSSKGEGIGHINGYSFFVKNAIKGERIRALVTKVKKNYGYAALKGFIDCSEDRVLPECKYYKLCGGCNLQHMSYRRQLMFKKDKINSALSKIGGLNQQVSEVIGANSRFRYRNKARYPVGYSEDGRMIAGFYSERSHKIVDIEDCILEPEINSEIIQTILSSCEKNGISAYNEGRHSGSLRHIMIRHAFETGEIMVILIVNNQEELSNKKMKALTEDMISTINLFNAKNPLKYKLLSFGINVNNKRTNVIIGEDTEIFYGNPYIVDRMNEVYYAIDTHSFYQVNHAQAEKLYREVYRIGRLNPNDIVFDMYCGAGTIGLYLADKVSRIYGAEIVPEAIEMAKFNAKLNHIDNAEFFCGSADKVAEILYKEKGIVPDAVIIDPPRKGCSEETIHILLNIHSEKIIYVSCDPATMARDLKLLTESGDYEVNEICGVDQFCQTYHVECIALIQRAKS